MDDAIDITLAATIASNAKSTMRDRSVYSSAENLGSVIGIPMPALSARYLFHLDVYPLGRFALLTGYRESCKSAMMFEIGRWHRLCGGNGMTLEVEQKDSEALRLGLCNYDFRAFKSRRCYTQDEWFRAFRIWMDTLELAMDGVIHRNGRITLDRKVALVDATTGKVKKGQKPEPVAEAPKKTRRKKDEPVKPKPVGRIAPMFIGIDSLSSGATEEAYELVMKDGAPTREFPVHAQLLSRFFQSAPKRLQYQPVSVGMVSHLKDSKEPGQHQKERITFGGKAPQHQITFEIQMSRRSDHEGTRQHPLLGNVTFIPLKISIFKNSLASHENLFIDFCWYFDETNRDPVSGAARQMFFFDWYAASIELILQCSAPASKGGGIATRRAKRLRDLIDLNKDDDKRTVWSDALGISQDDPMSYTEAGVLLEDKIAAEPEFARDLYDIMEIQRYGTFQPGIDLRDQISDRIKLIRKMNDGVPVREAVVPVTSAEYQKRLDALLDQIKEEVEEEFDEYDDGTSTSGAEEEAEGETVVGDGGINAPAPPTKFASEEKEEEDDNYGFEPTEDIPSE